MRINEARHQNKAVGFLIHFSPAGERCRHGCDAAVLNGHVRNAVKAVLRVHDASAANNSIPHVWSPFVVPDEAFDLLSFRGLKNRLSVPDCPLVRLAGFRG